MDTPGSIKRPSALLVDDDATTTPIHVRRLTREGYDVTAVRDSTTALDIARHSAPTIIFVHLGRKGLGCAEFVTVLRSGDDTRHIPVAILANYYDPRLEGLGLSTVARENI